MQSNAAAAPLRAVDALFDERVDDAVRKLQALWRGRKARALLQQLIRSSYLKVHGEHGGYLYLNRRTKELSRRKPRILKDDDLPSPRAYEAPFDYDPGLPPIPMYACLITCSTFDSPEIPMLDSVVTNDHGMIKDTLLHPFICRFSADDCLFLEDPTVDLVRHTFEDLRRCDKNGSLLVYLYNYFLFHDSSWRTREAAMNTSLSASKFAKLIQAIPCKHKTVLMHVCHRPPPAKNLMKKKLLYPDSRLYFDFAEQSGATVIGSCQLGSPAELVRQHMDLLRRKRKGVVGLLPRGITEDSTIKALREQQIKRRVPSPSDPTITREVDGTYSVALPREGGDTGRQFRRKIINYAGAVVRAYKRLKMHDGADGVSSVPRQQSLYGERYSNFARSFVQAINGGAAADFNELVTAKSVFLQMAEHLMAETEAEHEGNNHEDVSQDPQEGQQQQQRPTQAQQQNYAIACAHGGEPLQVVCAAPGRPPAPFIPTIVQVTQTSVSLRWEEPGFDGIPTAQYRIYFRTLARAFNNWTVLKTGSPIVEKSYRVVHLATGIPIAFKVAAWNSGGWGDASPPTEFVIPGGDSVLPQIQDEYSKLRHGGVYSTLLRLESVGHLLHEATAGMRLLIALLSKSNGFKRLVFATRAVAVAVSALRMHSLDVDVCASALQVIAWACKSYAQVTTQLEELQFVVLFHQNKPNWRLEPRILRAVESLRAVDAQVLPHDVLAADDSEETDGEIEGKPGGGV